MSDQRPTLVLLVAPALTMVLGLFVYPLALSLVSAFTARDGQPSLDNFVKAFELYGADIVFTLVIISVSTVLIGVLAAAIGGYLTLGAHPAAVAVLRALYRWPLFVPFIVAAQCMRTFLAKNGIMNNALETLGLVDVANLSGRRGTTSRVSVMSSPSLASLPPQHGQAAGAGTTTRSRGRCAGNGARAGFLRVNPGTTARSWPAAATSSSLALTSSSSSCSSSCSRSLALRSADGPKRSRRNLAMTSLRCATMASAPVARTSASWRAWRSAASAALSASIPSGRMSVVIGTDAIQPQSQATVMSSRSG